MKLNPVLPLRIPDEKLFEDRHEDFDWMKIAVKDLRNNHTAKECELHWKNLAHTAINRSPWTQVRG